MRTGDDRVQSQFQVVVSVTARSQERILNCSEEPHNSTMPRRRQGFQTRLVTFIDNGYRKHKDVQWMDGPTMVWRKIKFTFLFLCVLPFYRMLAVNDTLRAIASEEILMEVERYTYHMTLQTTAAKVTRLMECRRLSENVFESVYKFKRFFCVLFSNTRSEIADVHNELFVLVPNFVSLVRAKLSLAVVSFLLNGLNLVSPKIYQTSASLRE
ncbi:hypothetical protein NPIL_295821 [Nephila pilipes]|uniref:Uncharacterized protein n=1 Tax=Nephila pilipes TaxID=299642 RepID=A0A8X6PIQ7_NEPPI|nr:hypothetical protein NPIL_295821 [Nephila pilipes]